MHIAPFIERLNCKNKSNAARNRAPFTSQVKKIDSQAPFAKYHQNHLTNQFSQQPNFLFQSHKLFSRKFATNATPQAPEPPKGPTNIQNTRNMEQQTEESPRIQAANESMIKTTGMTIAKQAALYGGITAVAYPLVKSFTIIDFPTMPFIEGAVVYGALAGTTLSFILLADRLLVDQKVLSTLSSEIIRKMNLTGINGISAMELKRIFEVDLRKYFDSSVSWRNFLLFNGVSLMVPRFDSVYDSLSRKLSDRDIASNTSSAEILVTGLLEGVVRSQLLGWYDRLFYMAVVLYIVFFMVALAILYTSKKAKVMYGKVKETVSEKVHEIADQKDVLIDKASAGMKIIGDKKENLKEKAIEKKNELVSKMESSESMKERAASTKEKLVQAKDKLVESVKDKMSTLPPSNAPKESPKDTSKDTGGSLDTATIDTPLGPTKVDILPDDDYRNKNYPQIDPKNPETLTDPNLIQTNYPLNVEIRAEEIARKKEESKSSQ